MYQCLLPCKENTNTIQWSTTQYEHIWFILIIKTYNPSVTKIFDFRRISQKCVTHNILSKTILILRNQKKYRWLRSVSTIIIQWTGIDEIQADYFLIFNTIVLGGVLNASTFLDELAAKLIPFLYIISSHTRKFEAQSYCEVLLQSTYIIQRISGGKQRKNAPFWIFLFFF